MPNTPPPPGLIRWRGIVAVFNAADRHGVVTPYEVRPRGQRTTLPFAVPLPLTWMTNDTPAERCGLITDVYVEPDENDNHLVYGIGIVGGPPAELMRTGARLSCGLDVNSGHIEEVEERHRTLRIRHDWKLVGITVWPRTSGASAFPQVEIWHDEPEDVTS